MADFKKRETAHKLRIGDVLRGTPIIEDVPQETADPTQVSSGAVKEKFRFLELGDKKIIRINIIANIIEKYNSDGEKKYGSITVDDASGQIRLKVFGEDVNMFNELSEGDTITIIGLLRSYNGELYILPEITKKTDPRYLLVRKLELDKKIGKKEVKIGQSFQLRDQVIEIIKAGENTGGVSVEDIILQVKNADPASINEEVIKLIEDGAAYEPRPGKVRYLG
jgi:RPA family protein